MGPSVGLAIFYEIFYEKSIFFFEEKILIFFLFFGMIIMIEERRNYLWKEKIREEYFLELLGFLL